MEVCERPESTSNLVGESARIEVVCDGRILATSLGVVVVQTLKNTGIRGNFIVSSRMNAVQHETILVH